MTERHRYVRQHNVYGICAVCGVEAEEHAQQDFDALTEAAEAALDKDDPYGYQELYVAMKAERDALLKQVNHD